MRVGVGVGVGEDTGKRGEGKRGAGKLVVVASDGRLALASVLDCPRFCVREEGRAEALVLAEILARIHSEGLARVIQVLNPKP